MFWACRHQEVLWLSIGQTVQKGVEFIDVVFSKSNTPDSTVTTRSLIDITAALDTVDIVEDDVAQRRGEFGGSGRSTFISQPPRDGRLLLFLYVVRRSS